MKLSDIVDRVAAADTTADRQQLRRTVVDTIAALGLQVDARGEVYSPAPAPAYTAPVQRHARWSGSGRRQLESRLVSDRPSSGLLPDGQPKKEDKDA